MSISILRATSRNDQGRLRQALSPMRVGAICMLLALQPLLAEDALVVEPARSIGDGTIAVFRNSADSATDVLIHFHGAPTTVKPAFERSQLPGVLVIVNFPGLSSAYSQPFAKNPQLFDQILEQSLAATASNRAANGKQWRRIYLSSFSAGYGAVREILKRPQNMQRIDGIVAADSIYAGLQQEEPQRKVDESNMRDFLRFAEQAVASQKTFVISHSAQSTPYASTTETADYLLRAQQLERQRDSSASTQTFRQTSRAARGQFIVLGYAGTSGEEHMQHLHHIDLLWSHLAREE